MIMMGICARCTEESVYYCENCGTPRVHPRSDRDTTVCKVCHGFMERMDV